jgi:hypothetical protein
MGPRMGQLLTSFSFINFIGAHISPPKDCSFSMCLTWSLSWVRSNWSRAFARVGIMNEDPVSSLVRHFNKDSTFWSSAITNILVLSPECNPCSLR